MLYHSTNVVCLNEVSQSVLNELSLNFLIVVDGKAIAVKLMLN